MNTKFSNRWHAKAHRSQCACQWGASADKHWSRGISPLRSGKKAQRPWKVDYVFDTGPVTEMEEARIQQVIDDCWEEIAAWLRTGRCAADPSIQYDFDEETE